MSEERKELDHLTNTADVSELFEVNSEDISEYHKSLIIFMNEKLTLLLEIFNERFQEEEIHSFIKFSKNLGTDQNTPDKEIANKISDLLTLYKKEDLIKINNVRLFVTESPSEDLEKLEKLYKIFTGYFGIYSHATSYSNVRQNRTENVIKLQSLTPNLNQPNHEVSLNSFNKHKDKFEGMAKLYNHAKFLLFADPAKISAEQKDKIQQDTFSQINYAFALLITNQPVNKNSIEFFSNKKIQTLLFEYFNKKPEILNNPDFLKLFKSLQIPFEPELITQERKLGKDTPVAKPTDKYLKKIKKIIRISKQKNNRKEIAKFVETLKDTNDIDAFFYEVNKYLLSTDTTQTFQEFLTQFYIQAHNHLNNTNNRMPFYSNGLICPMLDQNNFIQINLEEKDKVSKSIRVNYTRAEIYHAINNGNFSPILLLGQIVSTYESNVPDYIKEYIAQAIDHYIFQTPNFAGTLQNDSFKYAWRIWGKYWKENNKEGNTERIEKLNTFFEGINQDNKSFSFAKEEIETHKSKKNTKKDSKKSKKTIADVASKKVSNEQIIEVAPRIEPLSFDYGGDFNFTCDNLPEHCFLFIKSANGNYEYLPWEKEGLFDLSKATSVNNRSTQKDNKFTFKFATSSSGFPQKCSPESPQITIKKKEIDSVNLNPTMVDTSNAVKKVTKEKQPEQLQYEEEIISLLALLEDQNRSQINFLDNPVLFELNNDKNQLISVYYQDISGDIAITSCLLEEDGKTDIELLSKKLTDLEKLIPDIIKYIKEAHQKEHQNNTDKIYEKVLSSFSESTTYFHKFNTSKEPNQSTSSWYQTFNSETGYWWDMLIKTSRQGEGIIQDKINKLFDNDSFKIISCSSQEQLEITIRDKIRNNTFTAKFDESSREITVSGNNKNQMLLGKAIFHKFSHEAANYNNLFEKSTKIDLNIVNKEQTELAESLASGNRDWVWIAKKNKSGEYQGKEKCEFLKLEDHHDVIVKDEHLQFHSDEVSSNKASSVEHFAKSERNKKYILRRIQATLKAILQENSQQGQPDRPQFQHFEAIKNKNVRTLLWKLCIEFQLVAEASTYLDLDFLAVDNNHASTWLAELDEDFNHIVQVFVKKLGEENIPVSYIPLKKTTGKNLKEEVNQIKKQNNKKLKEKTRTSYRINSNV